MLTGRPKDDAGEFSFPRLKINTYESKQSKTKKDNQSEATVELNWAPPASCSELRT